MVEQANLEVLYSGNHNVNNYDIQDDNNVRIDPYSLFLHAIKSPVTKKKYSRRLEMFFDFLKIPGESIEEQCLTFVNSGRNNVNWVFTNILKFVLFYKERIDKKERKSESKSCSSKKDACKYISCINKERIVPWS